MIRCQEGWSNHWPSGSSAFGYCECLQFGPRGSQWQSLNQAIEMSLRKLRSLSKKGLLACRHGLGTLRRWDGFDSRSKNEHFLKLCGGGWF
jgi:hypothetical protein